MSLLSWSDKGNRRAVVFYAPFAGPRLATREAVDGPGEPPGGAETQIAMLAEHLDRQGVSVGVLVYLEGSADGLALWAIPLPRRARSGSPARLAASTGLTMARQARTLIGSNAAVFVQRAAGPHTGLVAIVARVLRRRFVYSSANVIDFDYGRLERRRWNVWLFHLGVRLADAVVVQTPEQVELCRQRFGREPVLIKSIAEPAPRRDGVPDAFLWIGRMAHYKRPLAYVELARALPHARFWMVAVPSGPDAPGIARELEQAAAELPNLELLAPRPRGELQPLIDRAVAVVNTSDYEGMPNVLLEGWARGVPALALHHDPDGVIERERVGAFADSSQQRLVELARELWDGRHDQTELADRCQQYIEREHAPDVITSQWANTLTNLTSRPSVLGTLGARWRRRSP